MKAKFNKKKREHLDEVKGMRSALICAIELRFTLFEEICNLLADSAFSTATFSKYDIQVMTYNGKENHETFCY
jgi:hypothetical protein